MIQEELSNRIINILLDFFTKEAVAAVVLYGSYAENRETRYSDIDLLIILDKELSNWREKRRMEVSLRKETASVGPLSPRIMTGKEFMTAFENYDPLVLNALSSGRILYDTGTLKKTMAQFVKLENKNIAKTSEGFWEVAL